MIPAIEEFKPIDITLEIGGKEFKIIGTSDLERKVVTVSVTPTNAHTPITESIRAKIGEMLNNQRQRLQSNSNLYSR